MYCRKCRFQVETTGKLCPYCGDMLVTVPTVIVEKEPVYPEINAKKYLIFSIFAAVLGSILFGMCAVIQALKIDKKRQEEDAEGVLKAAKLCRTFLWISAFCFILYCVILFSYL